MCSPSARDDAVQRSRRHYNETGCGCGQSGVPGARDCRRRGTALAFDVDSYTTVAKPVLQSTRPREDQAPLQRDRCRCWHQIPIPVRETESLQVAKVQYLGIPATDSGAASSGNMWRCSGSAAPRDRVGHKDATKPHAGAEAKMALASSANKSSRTPMERTELSTSVTTALVVSPQAPWMSTS